MTENAHIKIVQEAQQIRDFLENPIITGMLDRIEHDHSERALSNPLPETREEARLMVLAVRKLRNEMKLKLMQGEVAKSELTKAKGKQDVA